MELSSCVYSKLQQVQLQLMHSTYQRENLPALRRIHDTLQAATDAEQAELNKVGRGRRAGAGEDRQGLGAGGEGRGGGWGGRVGGWGVQGQHGGRRGDGMVDSTCSVSRVPPSPPVRSVRLSWHPTGPWAQHLMGWLRNTAR